MANQGKGPLDLEGIAENCTTYSGNCTSFGLNGEPYNYRVSAALPIQNGQFVKGRAYNYSLFENPSSDRETREVIDLGIYDKKGGSLLHQYDSGRADVPKGDRYFPKNHKTKIWTK